MRMAYKEKGYCSHTVQATELGTMLSNLHALSALNRSLPDSYILEKYQLTRLNAVQPSGRTWCTYKLNGNFSLSVPILEQ